MIEFMWEKFLRYIINGKENEKNLINVIAFRKIETKENMVYTISIVAEIVIE